MEYELILQEPDWKSWDLDLGILALLALVPKYPESGPPHDLGSPLIFISFVSVLGNPASPHGTRAEPCSV